MPIFRVADRSTALTTGLASFTVLTGANRISILEIKTFLAAATASVFSYGRPTAAGVTSGGSTLFQADDPAVQASTTNRVLAWTTAPTAPTVAMERWSGPATIGTGVILTFPRGIVVAVSSNFVTHNLAATVAAADHGYTIEE
jgi:hypothetical protein